MRLVCRWEAAKPPLSVSPTSLAAYQLLPALHCLLAIRHLSPPLPSCRSHGLVVSGTYQGASVALKRMSQSLSARKALDYSVSGAATPSPFGRRRGSHTSLRGHGFDRRRSVEPATKRPSERGARTSLQRQSVQGLTVPWPGSSSPAATAAAAAGPASVAGSERSEGLAGFHDSAVFRVSSAGGRTSTNSEMGREIGIDEVASSSGVAAEDDIVALFAGLQKRAGAGARSKGSFLTHIFRRRGRTDVSAEVLRSALRLLPPRMLGPPTGSDGCLSLAPAGGDLTVSAFRFFGTSRTQMSLLVRLRHPNIATVFGAVVDLAEPVLVMARRHLASPDTRRDALLWFASVVTCASVTRPTAAGCRESALKKPPDTRTGAVRVRQPVRSPPQRHDRSGYANAPLHPPRRRARDALPA